MHKALAMKGTYAERTRAIEEAFELLGDHWELRYEHLIELGKTLAPFPEQYKNDAHLIKGCQSSVWLHASLMESHVIFVADSDAIITKGIVALLINALSGLSPQEIVHADMRFISRIGLDKHLSPTRANGLLSMIRQMKLLAAQLSVKN